MEEIFKDIKGFEGDYQISTTGDVYSIKFGKRKLMKLRKTHNGYLYVGLYKDGKQKMFKVHRLVAEAFLPNTQNLPFINHKNEIKDDNRVENLEFCDHKYNVNYGTRVERIRGKLTNGKRSKPVDQYTKEGMLVGSYPSASEAERQTGFSQGSISYCCRGERKSCGGYIWRYAE